MAAGDSPAAVLFFSRFYSVVYRKVYRDKICFAPLFDISLWQITLD
jgi:hypothetical protein